MIATGLCPVIEAMEAGENAEADRVRPPSRPRTTLLRPERLLVGIHRLSLEQMACTTTVLYWLRAIQHQHFTSRLGQPSYVL
jgi:hypothetical protein